MYNFAGDFVYVNSESTSHNHRVCDKMANDLLINSMKICALVFLSINLGACAPIYKLTSTDEKEMVIPVILPFVDPDTELGFYLNMVNQFVICLYGSIIIPGVVKCSRR